MKYKLIGKLLVWTWAVVSTLGSTALSAPLPRLQVSQTSPHTLVTQAGEPYFLNADTAWALAWKLDRKLVQTYLQHRKAQRFNAIAVVAFPSGLDSTNFDKQNVYGDQPFEQINGKWDPTRPVITLGSRPDNRTEYDYWDHLNYIIKTAELNQMYVILLPTWGNYVAGSWSGASTSEIIFNRTNAYAYARFLGDRYRSRSNLIWMLGGDRSAVYGSRDYRPVFRSLAEGIADGVNGEDNQDNLADYSTTLISYHPRKDSVSSSAWFHSEA